jgi:hypothetical protein
MSVDVVSEITINRSIEVVSAFAGDPTNAPTWYKNIEAVEWKTEPPLKIGSEAAFVARFLGRTLAYTYESSELVSGERPGNANCRGSFSDGDDVYLDGCWWGYSDDSTEPGRAFGILEAGRAPHGVGYAARQSERPRQPAETARRHVI